MSVIFPWMQNKPWITIYQGKDGRQSNVGRTGSILGDRNYTSAHPGTAHAHTHAHALTCTHAHMLTHKHLFVHAHALISTLSVSNTHSKTCSQAHWHTSRDNSPCSLSLSLSLSEKVGVIAVCVRVSVSVAVWVRVCACVWVCVCVRESWVEAFEPKNNKGHKYDFCFSGAGVNTKRFINPWWIL